MEIFFCRKSNAFIKYVGYNKKELIGYPIFKNNIIYEISEKFKKKLENDGEVKRFYVTGIGKNEQFLEGYLSAKFIILKNIQYLLVVILPKIKEIVG